MLILIGVILACLGAGTMVAAQRHVLRQQSLLRFGTALLCAGATLLAASFPMI